MGNDQWIQGAASFSSSLSIVGSLYIICSYYRVKYYSRNKYIEFTKDLICTLAWFDLIGACGRVFGQTPAQFGHTACQIQAFVIEFGDIAPITWNLIMAFNLYRWVCVGEEEDHLRSRYPLYFLGSLTFSIGICSACLAADHYGDAALWCWVVNDTWKYLALYLWIVLAAIIMTAILICVRRDIVSRSRWQRNYDATVACNGIGRKLFLYIASFLILWTPGLLDRTVGVLHQPVFICSFLHAAFVPLQGFVNAIIYGGLHTWIGRQFKKQPKFRETHRGSSSMISLDIRDNVVGSSEGVAKVFISSFDMNGGPVPLNLESWIPKGYDMYAIAVQQCNCLDELITRIKSYLECVNSPMTYTTFSAHVGSNSCTIAQLIFAKTTDVELGNFHVNSMRSGTSRGAVGMPVRYFDTSLAFVSLRLGRGTSIQQRNQHCNRVMRHLRVSGDESGIDFPLLYQHSIVLGNLSYGMMNQSKELIDGAIQAEKNKVEADQALEDFFHVVRPSDCSTNTTSDYEYTVAHENKASDGVPFTILVSPNCSLSNVPRSSLNQMLSGTEDAESEQERQKELHELIRNANEADCEARLKWQNVLSLDELRAAMEHRLIFANFNEPSIHFPPAEPAISYADRILLHSLPDVSEKLRVKDYWIAQDIKTSKQKPICSSVDLDIDRLYAFKLQEDEYADEIQGHCAMRDKTHIQNYSIHLSDLRALVMKQSSRFRVSGGLDSIDTFGSSMHSEGIRLSPPFDHPEDDKLSCDWRSSGAGDSLNDEIESVLDVTTLVSIFPLPSEDIFAEHRKLHEVAASVEGFERVTEDILSYQNSRKTPWEFASQQGVEHSAITRSINGKMHMAIKLVDNRGRGGHGVICIDESLHLDTSTAIDIELTNGGRHVGYFCGTMLLSLK